MEKLASILFNLLMLIVGLAISFVFFKSCYDKTPEEIQRVDTIIIKEKPVVNEFHIKEPTLLRETVIVYDSTKKELTREDSNLIVQDYLKQRVYVDSTWSIKGSDSMKAVYNAIVEKNALKDIYFEFYYKPKTFKITETKYRNSFFAGFAPGYFRKFTIALHAGFETKHMGYGITFDPFIKGGYIHVNKRFNF